jgi:hypothetical protein
VIFYTAIRSARCAAGRGMTPSTGISCIFEERLFFMNTESLLAPDLQKQRQRILFGLEQKIRSGPAREDKIATGVAPLLQSQQRNTSRRGKRHLPPRFLRLRITQSDIDQSLCGNRRRCMVAVAFKRTYLDDGDHGYLTVDENGIAVTSGGMRWTYGLSKPSRKRAKYFDLDKSSASPFTVYATLGMKKLIRPKADRTRRDQINAARRKANAARRARGEPRPSYTRFI